ncbi:MAG TPA: PilZ domain-containing protein [Candidatus Acidoferrales bacterium]|nr:PilZ domain-containing protein [Candidatus Acidoferrales bacterium]
MEVERRQHERQKLYSPEYFDMGADNGGMVVDISENGIGFQAVGRVEKGDEIAVSFSLGSGYRISARARIAWVGSNGNSGGSTFTNLPADSRSIIREWVARTAETVVTHEAAASVESEISTRAPDPDVPLVIERLDGSVAPLPEQFAEPKTPLEVPGPELIIQHEFSATEPLTNQSVAQRFTQPGVPTEPVPPARPIFRPLAPPAFPPVVPESEAEVVGHVASRIAEPAVETVVLSDGLADTQRTQEPVPAAAEEARYDSTAAPSATASAPAPSSGMPLSFPASAIPKIPKRRAEPRREAAATPPAPPRAEVRPSFPPRNTGELFSRSPWISGESFPEEERGHKVLIVVILLILFGAAGIASLPYVRAHRQQIGSEIETMGKNVSGQATPNPDQSQTAQGARQNPPVPAPQGAQQSSQQRPERSPGESSEAAPQSPAPLPATPSATGPVIPGGASSAGATPAGTPPASAATSASSGLGINGAANPSTASPLAMPSAMGDQVPAASGQFEFHQAQKYLNGTGGVSADPGEAAEWFWRSLEKGNTDAAIPLADLYLQGKGVSHSCLQARILLTTASHKGNTEAIQKLNQLPENCEQ